MGPEAFRSKLLFLDNAWSTIRSDGDDPAW
jgi:hypothetical protein